MADTSLNGGDIVWLDFDPQSGHEQKGKCLALVLSPKAYNQKVGLGVFCPLTSQEKGYPFEVKIHNDKINGVVLSDQIKSLDWIKRKAQFITRSTDKETKAVIDKVSVLIIP